MEAIRTIQDFKDFILHLLKFINYIIYLTLYQQRFQLLFYSYSNIIIYSKNFNNY